MSALIGRIFKKFGGSARQEGEGLSQCRHFADKGVGNKLFGICADVFYGRPFSINVK